MSHRSSGWVGAVVLALVVVSSACGGRDNLFVLDDAAPSGGGTTGHAGTFGVGGYAGTVIGVAGHGGVIGSAGYAGTFGVGGHAGTVGFGGHGGTIGVGGGVTAFGGTGGFGIAGFAGFGAVGGTSGSICALCAALNDGTNPCALAECVGNTCVFVPVNDGLSCFNGNLCAQNVCKAGQCIAVSAVTCPVAAIACQTTTCDPNTGQCVNQPLTGTACDDGDPCTLKDQCTAGKCTPGMRLNSCQNNDKCCPAGCTSSTDNDCTAPKQIVLSTTDRGWYQNAGVHEPVNKNTLTGFSSGFKYNSYFSFDLSAVTGTIVSAQLALEQQMYYGTDASETASIWDVTTNADVLSVTQQSVAIFTDLQSGTQYGSLTGTPQTTGTIIKTPLNAQAVSALNAARGGKFSVGLHLDTLSGQAVTDEGLRFSASDEPRMNQLILTVQ